MGQDLERSSKMWFGPLAIAAALFAATVLVGVQAPHAEAQQACPSGSVALTFDDGPSVDTAAVLDILAEHSVLATFFVMGQNVDERPEMTARAASEGHAVANHTYGHERLTELSDAAIEQTVMDADDAIRRAGVEPTMLLRPPFGATDDRVASIVGDLGYTEELWTVDPRDWEPDSTAAEVRDYVLANLHDGAVVLLHDWTAPEVSAQADASNTIGALPEIIDGARDQGYCFGYLDDAGVIQVPDETTPEPAAGDQPALVADRTWSLRQSLSSGGADIEFTYGRSGDRALMCDWNGDGARTPGIVRDGEWHLRNSNRGGSADRTFHYGRADDTAVCGDWNGDGTDTVGVRRGAQWFLRDSNTGGSADRVFHYGRSDDVAVTGDWNGSGQASVGVVRDRQWLLRNSNSGGSAEISFTFGRSDDLPVVGDWEGLGHDRPGIVRGDTWHVRYALQGGSADVTFDLDAPGDVPLSWR